LPGYYHQKDATNPYLVRCLYIDPGLVYTEDEMIENFGISKIDAKEYYEKYKPREDQKSNKKILFYDRTP
jgi:hypothetical protein